MRIGMILDKTFPPDPRVENEALALIDAGHSVFLFCLGYQNEIHSDDYKGIQIKRYQSSQLIYKLSALAYTFPFYRKMMSGKIHDFLKQNDIDVIHIHDMVIAETVIEVNKNFGLPLVLDLHENRPEIMKTYPHLNTFPGKFMISPTVWKKKEEAVVKKVDRVIVVSKEAKAELSDRVNLSDEQIIVVPNTVSSKFSKEYVVEESILERYKNKYVILYLGDTGLRRGLISMIEALSVIASKPGLKDVFKLVIVGQNSSDPILKKKVTDLGIEEMVDFEGWQEIGKFPSYIEAAHIGVSPLHRNLHHDTTYANKLFQYMSFGLVVLVSDAIAQRNLVEEVHSGLIHKAENVDDIADKLLTLYNDNDLSDKLGSNGKRFIEEVFCWEKVSDDLKNLYLNFKKV